jgi:hypothetical protein
MKIIIHQNPKSILVHRVNRPIEHLRLSVSITQTTIEDQAFPLLWLIP